ncbi:MAG: c-type cytochrome [Granulosicoccus sp.]
MSDNEGITTEGMPAEQQRNRDGTYVDRAYERENYEPAELKNPLPKWFSIMSLGFVIWGAGYFYFQGVVPADAGDHRTPLAIHDGGAADGATVYAGNCVACHQGTGLGISGAFPPLDGAEWVTGAPELLAQILLHGVQGEMQVLGTVYNGVMPSMAHLSDEELAAVSTHIRSSWSNNASAIDSDFIAEQRTRFDVARGPWQGGAELRAEIGEPVSTTE